MPKRFVRNLAVLVSLTVVTAAAPPALAGQPLGGTCHGHAVTVDLNLGHAPTGGDDVILGTPGDDTIDAAGGDDIVCGGAGDDRLLGRGGDDILIGGAGRDVIIGHAGKDELIGGGGSDRLRGGGGADIVRGGGGDDLIDGGPGSDPLLAGGGGDDLVDGGDGDDVAYGNAGDDELYGDAGDDHLAGNQGVDLCDGGVGGETVGDHATASCETVVNVDPGPTTCRPDTTQCVGPGQLYETLTAAVAAAGSGAVVEVLPGTYNETVAVMADGVTIRASTGARPTIDCSGMRPAWGKACILAVGTDLTIERLRVTGARWSEGNEACFRNEPDTDVTIRGVLCFDSNNGILGSGGSWLVINSTFTGNGAGDGQTHNLYFSGDCSRVVVRGITSSVSNGGHAFKSRCQVSRIEDSLLIENTVADGADFSDGGVATIVNTRIEQPDGANGNMIRHGSESCTNGGRLRIEDSTIVSDRSPSYIRSTCAAIQIVNSQLPSGVIIIEP